MIRGTKRKYTSAPNKRFDVGASIHNRFDIEVIDHVSGEVKQKAFAENVICNQLWTRLFGGYMWNSYIHYGDGSGTPSASDTSLFSHLGTEQSEVYNMEYDYDREVFACTKKVVVDETKAVGKTLTEVGIAYSSASSALCTHAMLQDMNGNPVSLEKSDTDIFNIYATVFIHFTMPSKHVRMLGSYRFDNDWWTTGLLQFFIGITSSPSLDVPTMLGTVPVNQSGYKTVTPTYDASNRTITYTADRMSASEFNVGGLPSLILRSYTSYGHGPAYMVIDVVPDDGWFGGTHITGEAIGTGDGVTCDFATRFGYAANAKVYVDGVEVQTTVDCINHVLHQQRSSYSGLGNPIWSYFRVLRAPEIGYGYSNPYEYKIAPVIFAQSSYTSGYSMGQQFDHPVVFENSIFETHGVREFYGTRSTIKASNDLKSWATIFDGLSATFERDSMVVPEEYQHYRYWSIQSHIRNTVTGSNQKTIIAYANKDLATMTNNVHFSEPPASGAVITVDYDAVCIAKDENHVFDFSIAFKFNEYVGT